MIDTAFCIFCVGETFVVSLIVVVSFVYPRKTSNCDSPKIDYAGRTKIIDIRSNPSSIESTVNSPLKESAYNSCK